MHYDGPLPNQCMLWWDGMTPHLPSIHKMWWTMPLPCPLITLSVPAILSWKPTIAPIIFRSAMPANVPLMDNSGRLPLCDILLFPYIKNSSNSLLHESLSFYTINNSPAMTLVQCPVYHMISRCLSTWATLINVLYCSLCMLVAHCSGRKRKLNGAIAYKRVHVIAHDSWLQRQSLIRRDKIT